MNLSGRTILITGGSNGIGAAAVRRFYDCGASVFFTYRSDESAARALCAQLGDRVAAAYCDLAEHDRLPDVVETCTQRFGPIDVLVNN
jgi:3-oxoacyl-[acyl-carrier protein] reductase